MKLLGNKGTSLLEMVIASTIVAIGAATLFTVFSHSSSISRDIMLREKVYQQLENVLESEQFGSGSSVLLCGEDTTLISDSIVTIENVESAPGIKGSLTVELYRVSYSGGGIGSVPARKIRAIMSWVRCEGISEACSLETLATLLTGAN